MANEQMKTAWDGDEGERWAEHAARYEAQSVHMHRVFFDVLALQPTETVLDVGCGNGGTSLHAAEQ